MSEANGISLAEPRSAKGSATPGPIMLEEKDTYLNACCRGHGDVVSEYYTSEVGSVAQLAWRLGLGLGVADLPNVCLRTTSALKPSCRKIRSSLQYVSPVRRIQCQALRTSTCKS